MSGIIEGYNYDIFISYRQKDNQPTPGYGWQSKGDRWVSEFVEALKTELESTFKEEISVYFDINPHDGLLETHDVDASLKDKLRCLVFIPIISRTYCDPKSFAWEHEFKAFVEQASKDQFGLKIKLLNGNVANRILPIHIHDLDNADVKLCESILGGILRGVEFIYKEPGVNRSLSPKDHEEKNLNNTNYRNQINKVALAIKEIILGLQIQPVPPVIESIKNREQIALDKEEKQIKKAALVNLNNRKVISVVLILAILIIAAILAYPKIFKQNTFEKMRSSGKGISVVVMPFQNMTNDTIWNIWQKGIQENIITYLSNFPDELKVRQTETVNSLIQGKNLTDYALITPSIAKTISQKLEANVYIYGSIQQAGTRLRLNAKLIETNTSNVLQSFEIDAAYKEEIILDIADSLRRKVADFLIISEIKKELVPGAASLITTNSPKAYRYYAHGFKSFSTGDFSTALDWYLKAIAIDSNLLQAYLDLSSSYSNLGMIQQAHDWCLRAYKKRNMMPIGQQIYTNFIYSIFYETPYEQLKYLKQLQKMDDKMVSLAWLGNAYSSLGLHDKALAELEMNLEKINMTDINPDRWAIDYAMLGGEYHYTGQYRKEKKLYKEAEKYFPDDPQIIYQQAILAVAQNDLKNADFYIEKYKSHLKEKSSSKVEILCTMANIYSEGNSLDKAEEYFRQALSLQPDNSDIMTDLAFFLIYKDRNVNEGMELIEKALSLNNDNYFYLYVKGSGLYKQAKYKEALEVLQKSWDLRRQSAYYDHEAFLLLEAAKKAVAEQKTN